MTTNLRLWVLTVIAWRQRALRDRKTEGKKRAAQIIGSLYSLTKPKDLVPYLPKVGIFAYSLSHLHLSRARVLLQVTPGLKDALVDPLPEVRGVTAKAFGAMVKGMGEQNFAELMPWMLETLCSEAGTVDRSGAAQVWLLACRQEARRQPSHTLGLAVGSVRGAVRIGRGTTGNHD